MAEQIRLPTSGGGLVRYFEDYKSKIEIGPVTVMVVIAIILLFELYLHTFRPLG